MLLVCCKMSFTIFAALIPYEGCLCCVKSNPPALSILFRLQNPHGGGGIMNKARTIQMVQRLRKVYQSQSDPCNC